MVTGKRALVTGGAGFLGSHLCECLLDRGDDVLCVDNFFSSSRHNITHLLDNPRMELLRHDLPFRSSSRSTRFSISLVPRLLCITSLTHPNGED